MPAFVNPSNKNLKLFTIHMVALLFPTIDIARTLFLKVHGPNLVLPSG